MVVGGLKNCHHHHYYYVAYSVACCMQPVTTMHYTTASAATCSINSSLENHYLASVPARQAGRQLAAACWIGLKEGSR